MRLIFKNGYGASVIYTGYGAEEGFCEVAVLGPDGNICYDTPITGDVLGWLTREQAEDVLRQIAELPSCK